MPDTPISLLAEFTIRRGKVAEALKLIEAVKRQSEREQPGTLVYLAHHVLDKRHRPTRTLRFYERYRDQAALDAHLDASSWRAVVRDWEKYFEGAPPKGRNVEWVAPLAEFARQGAIRTVKAHPARRGATGPRAPVGRQRPTRAKRRTARP